MDYFFQKVKVKTKSWTNSRIDVPRSHEQFTPYSDWLLQTLVTESLPVLLIFTLHNIKLQRDVITNIVFRYPINKWIENN